MSCAVPSTTLGGKFYCACVNHGLSLSRFIILLALLSAITRI